MSSFHSRIGIFESCQYSNRMFGDGAKYITKSQVRHSTVIITEFNTQGKCVTDASRIFIKR